jgi:TRAP-type uncharacterized transport system substrate-binding protein
MELLNPYHTQIAFVQSDTPVKPPVCTVARLYPEMFHLLVRKEANIETVTDLENKKIILMPEGSGSYALF